MAPEKRAEIIDIAEKLLDNLGAELRLIEGKAAVEFRPRNFSKEAAIIAFMAEPPFEGCRPVYIGDDMIDEAGFVEINRRGGISIRVGSPTGATSAAFNLPSVPAVLDWLNPHRL